MFGDVEKETPELAADTFVALCTDSRAKVLSGNYVDSQQDLGEVLEDALKGKDGRIATKRLYHL